jgi:cytochrome c oxidase subunit I+III
LIATGFFSFGLWVHHMFTTGIPALSLSFFSAASMAVALPSGIQVFAWIATIASGRLRWTTPSLFVLGFLFIFTLGGLTGVMVAMVPFDWQAHDTYFVVAHFHYVLVGGMVFPLFAAFYYWAPAFSRRPLSERLGRWTFWLMFAGFNIAFFPMHLSGLMGMPRRVYTYPAVMEWGVLNMISTIGAFLVAAGIALFLIDLVRNLRPTLSDTAGNTWNGATLEWLPNNVYGPRSIPIVTSADPLWDQPRLAEEVEAGRYYLPGSITGLRETIVTSSIEATPQYLLRLPGPGWTPLLAAIFTAAFFMLLTVKAVTLALTCGVLMVAFVIAWMWDSDPKPLEPVDIGGGIKLAAYASGSLSHSWWAMIVLLLVAGSLYLSYVFSYLYLWTVSPQFWPKPAALAPIASPVVSAFLLVAGSVILVMAERVLPRRARGSRTFEALTGLAVVALVAALMTEVSAQWQTGLRPEADIHSALVSMAAFLQAQLTLAVLVMAGFAIGRSLGGRLDLERRVVFDNCGLLYHYAVGQSLLGLLLVHGFPRLAGGASLSSRAVRLAIFCGC